MGKKIKRPMPRIDRGVPAFLPEFVTHAQNFEDVMLRRALPDVKSGFYVDIGAFHPSHHSVSYWFYQNGWTGINVEPNEKFFAILEAKRQRDINLRVAVTGTGGLARLYLHDALSTIQDEVAAVHRQNGLDLSHVAQVEAMTLDQLFDGYVQSRTVDFLKLDVEGSEGEILNSTNFERARPRILVVEATKPDSREPTWQGWERGLLKNGYLLAWFDGLNRFYVREEDRWRRKLLKVPPNVFDSVKFAPDDSRIKYDEGQSTEALSLALATARQQISSLDSEREHFVARAGTLERDLQHAQADAERGSAESERLASVSGHLERALSTTLGKLWHLNGETDALIRQRAEAEGEAQAAGREITRLVAERDAVAADKNRAQDELQASRSEHARLVAERDAAAADSCRAEGELQAARSENARLGAERDRLAVELARQQIKLQARDTSAAELEAVRSENSRLLAERDRLTVEIARYQIKQRARADLAAERERLATESARWFEAAVAAAYARRSQPAGSRRHLKLLLTATGWRLKCAVSRSASERGPRMSLALGERALNERQWQLAARCFGDVLEQWPNNAAVWVQFGHALKEAGRIAEAEGAYRQAIELGPATADAHLQLGHALKLQGRADAAQAYAAALRLNPALNDVADELLALGWSHGDIEREKSYDPPSRRRSPDGAPRRGAARLAFQRMFQ